MFCEKCGFDYEGEKCPVCEAEASTVAVEQAEKSPCGLIGMIMGIASFFMIGWPLAAAGLVLSIIGKKKCATDGMATAGVITSIISLVINVLSALAAIVFLVLYFIFIFGVGVLGASASTVY